MITTRQCAIYTCITGGYDPLHSPTVISEGIDYYCFTESNEPLPPPWRRRPIDLPHLGPKEQNRFIKMHPHLFLPAYEWTLYIDGSIQVVGPLEELFNEVLGRESDMFMFEHPIRTCIYQEAEVCSRLGYDWFWRVSRQVRGYAREGFPATFGLFEGGIILRRDTTQVRAIMEAWWNEYLAGVRRDQLSLTYVAKKLGVQIGSLGRSDHANDKKYFNFINHQVVFRPKVLLKILINRLAIKVIKARRLFGPVGPV